MPFPKYPIGSVVRLKKTNEFALIVGYNLLMNKLETFLNYYVEIEGRGSAIWAAYNDDIELECLPVS